MVSLSLEVLTNDVRSASKTGKKSVLWIISEWTQPQSKRIVEVYKKDNISISPLLEAGTEIIDAEHKAECFSAYFASVFSKQARTSSCAVTLSMIAVTHSKFFNLNGIAMLLDRLSIVKASGPDGLPNVLRVCSHSVALFLKIIVKKSLANCSFPDD